MRENKFWKISNDYKNISFVISERINERLETEEPVKKSRNWKKIEILALDKVVVKVSRSKIKINDWFP